MKNRRRKSKVAALVLSAILLTGSLAVPVFAAKGTGVETSSVMRSVPGRYECTGDDVNVRTGPGTSYTVVGMLKRGAIVYVYSISNGWARINFGGYSRYVSSQYLKEL